MNDNQAERLIESLRETNSTLREKLEQIDRSLDQIKDQLREINN